MTIACGAHDAPARGPHDHALLHEKRLDHFFDRIPLLIHCGREGFDADGTAAVMLDDAAKVTPVHDVETATVDFETVERAVGAGGVDSGDAVDRRKVAHPAQQAHRHTRGATGPARNLRRAVAGNAEAEQVGATADDALKIRIVIELKSQRNAEALAQRPRDQMAVFLDRTFGIPLP